MNTDIRPGARVLVRFDRQPPTWSPCHLHLADFLPTEGTVGVVDRIDPRYGEHCWIVEFPTIACPPFGTAWADCFTASELVATDE